MVKSAAPFLRPIDKTHLPWLAVVSARDAEPGARLELRIWLRENELRCRLSANRMRVAGRIADGVAKFGGGSLLTTAIALVIGGQVGWLIVGIAALTLLCFVIGTMLAGAFEYRAAIWDFEAERLAAALSMVGSD